MIAALLLAFGGATAAVAAALHRSETKTRDLPSGGAKVSPSFAAQLRRAAQRFPADVLAAARKWSAKRGIPLQEVVATILLESRGDPKAHLLNDREDSRGVMQVNVRAHGALLKAKGYTAADLFRPDVAVELGTEIYRRSRKQVEDLVGASGVVQHHPIATLARLRYAGPAYVDKMLKTAKKTEQTAHPFRNSETYVAKWDAAMAVAKGLV